MESRRLSVIPLILSFFLLPRRCTCPCLVSSRLLSPRSEPPSIVDQQILVMLGLDVYTPRREVKRFCGADYMHYFCARLGPVPSADHEMARNSSETALLSPTHRYRFRESGDIFRIRYNIIISVCFGE